jgi:NodT family efflux transporter outer membrane factor (OMF) lipoprotein
MKTQALFSVSFAALALGLAACASAPHAPEPSALAKTDVPAAFAAPAARGAPTWPSAGWWAGFGSPELDDLVAKAEAGNLDLAAAAARLQQAEAQSRISRAALYPTVDLQSSADRVHSPGPRSAEASAFGVSLAASYQLDLWGKARSEARAANQLILVSGYAQEAVALSVTSDVADAYLDVRALRERAAIARQNLDTARRILKVVQAKVANGATTRLDLAQQETQVRSLEAVVPELDEQALEAKNALAILLGRPPEGFDVQGQSLDGLAAPQVAPGLPSDLLRRRPDVAEAEADLASARANVDAARAAFLPQIGLTGSGGFASAALNSLLSGPAFGWTLGAALLQPIFDGGQLKGQFALSQARQQELTATYRSAALNAFSDVETALGQTASLAQQEQSRTAQAAAAAEAVRLAEAQYRRGSTDLLALLTAQQTLFSAQDALAQVKLARLQADVGLYRALGGGWDGETGAVRALALR